MAEKAAEHLYFSDAILCDASDDGRRARRRGLNAKFTDLPPLQIPPSPVAPAFSVNTDSETATASGVVMAAAGAHQYKGSVDLTDSRPNSPEELDIEIPATAEELLKRGRSLRGRVSPFPT